MKDPIRFWVILAFVFSMPYQSWAKGTQFCGISPQDLKKAPLDAAVENLIKKSCAEKSGELSKILNSALLSVSVEQRKLFLTHLSQSHPEAQKRLFNKLSSLSVEQTKEVILKISSLQCKVGGES